LSPGLWIEQLWGVWGNSPSEVFAVGAFDYTDPFSSSAITYQWSSMPNHGTAYLRGVWGTSSSDVFAVGKNREWGVGEGKDHSILHYNGSAWSNMSSGTTEALWGGLRQQLLKRVRCW